MAEAFFKVLMENLSSLIQREVGLIMGVDKEMKKLESTLTTIQTVLEDAEDKQLKSKPIQNWLIKVNDIAYEIDDILDECATEVSKPELKGCNFGLRKKVSFRRKIGRRIKQVAEKLDAIAAERQKFHLREIVVPQSSHVDARRETGSVLNEPDHIYGRDEDKEKIVDILVNQVTDCQHLSVLPIIGVGGLGKTTLAQLVYNDHRVTQHFDTKFWVCVSDHFDVKILLKSIIEFATGSAPDLVHLAALQRRLGEVLKQKRYLLILDDVWNEDQESWFMLKSILACGSKGASIVVTTRLKKVADIVGTLPALCLEGLSEEDCWLLFRLRAFGREENEQHPNLENIGRQIVKKCAGVPLAAKALGGLLRFKRNEKEWVRVKESEIWNLPEEETLILPALKLSYHHLPLGLRRCFVYCAVFPKDSTINKEELIFRWMAHGCISSNGTQEVEDVGDQAWNELVLRSFFQEVNVWGSFTRFKMHDLVHDLAQSIMDNKIPGAQMESINGVSASNSKIRELHWSEYSEICPSLITHVSALTTITNYDCLRMLKLNRTRVGKLPSAIGKLKHLRYLDLSNSSIHTLPHTFCGLWNLQILILDWCYNLKSLPRHIRYMTNLRHIFLRGCKLIARMPSRIVELTCLKTLGLFIVGQRIGNQLDELEHLDLGGRLVIKHLERTQNHLNAKKTNLVNKRNLRELFLHWGREGDSKMMDDEKVLEVLEPHPNLEFFMICGFEGGYFPLWMIKMENSTCICIKNCPNCSHLQPLGDLPHLQSLDLENLAALEYINGKDDEIRGQNSVEAKFPSLERLRLDSLPNLKGLSKEEVGETTFPNLQFLCIEECSLLTLSSLSKLENLAFLRLEFSENTTTCNLEDALEEQWFRGQKSLTHLWIRFSNISSLPKGWLRHLSALEEQGINACWELVELPQEIKYLHLLKRLVLSDLPQLTSLPDWLCNHTSLEHLQISGCPQLKQRCEKEKGEDWHKIAHIPHHQIY